MKIIDGSSNLDTWRFKEPGHKPTHTSRWSICEMFVVY